MTGLEGAFTLRQGPLCWGQHWSWLLDAAPTRRRSPAPAVSLVARLPAGTGLGRLRHAVDVVAGRHEALRSVFTIGPDGLPVQQVLPGCAPVVKVVEVSGRASRPAAIRGELIAMLERELDPSWNVAADPPLQVVVGTVGGTPELMLLSFHIVAVDGVSVGIVFDELYRSIGNTSADHTPGLPPVEWQPLDQAAFEASPRMSERSRRNLDGWGEFLRAAPPTALPFTWENILGYAKGGRAQLVSRRLGRACATIAQRCSASESAVLLAGFVSMLATWSGQAGTIVGETVACRYTPAMQPSVGRYKAVTRFLVDVSREVHFDELVRRTQAESARAHVESIGDEGALAMLMSRESVAQGSRIEYPPQFNYHHYAADGDPVVARRLPGSAWIMMPSTDDSLIVESGDDIPLPLPQLDVWPSAGGALRILLRCSTRLLPDGGRAFLEQLERLIRTAAERPSLLMPELVSFIDLPRFWEGSRWLSLRGSWFSLDDVDRLLCEHPGVEAARAFHEGAGRLSAYVAAVDERLDVQQLHEHMRDRISTWPTAMLPCWYTVCRGVPPDGTSRAGWRAREVIDEGPGRVARRTAPRGRNERMLLRSLAVAAPRIQPDLSASYAELHGDFLGIPAVIAELARAGYHGLTHQDLLGMATLARLASKLEPGGSTS